MATDPVELIREAFELLDSDRYEEVLPLIDERFEMVTTREVASEGQVIVEFAIRARGQRSGVEAEQPAVALATVAEGKLLRLEFFTSLDRARAAAQPRSG